MQKLVDNTLVHYLSFGNKTGARKVLFLHGWGRSSSDWVEIAKIMSKDYYCIIADLPGFGATSADFSKPWSIEKYTNLVEKFLNKLEITPDLIIAHSFGGKIAILLEPKFKLKKLILISPSVAIQKNLLTKIKISLVRFTNFLLFFIPNKQKKKIAKFLSSDDYKSAGEMLPTFKLNVNEQLVQEAKQVKTDTLIIWGEKDKQVNMDNSKRLNKLIKNSHVRVVWGEGHDPHLTSKQTLLQILKEEGVL